MLALWRRFLRWLSGARRPELGIVCHRLTDEDVSALRAMYGAKRPLVRLTLYADGDGAQWIDRAFAEGFDVLVVSKRAAADYWADRDRWPMALWQYGNEPDYALPPAPQLGAVSPGLKHGTPTAWVAEFAHEMPPGQVLALHAYGDPLVAGVRETIAKIPKGRRCWLTEIGVKDNAQQLADALRAIDGRVVERVYVYALWSPDDGYSLTSAQQSTLTEFLR